MSQKIIMVDGIPTLEIENTESLDGLELIDVRRPDEYYGELGHIAGAQLATLGTDLEEHLETLDNDLKVLFICRSGSRSAQATLMAQDMGFKNAINMQGGMLNWNKLKLPVE